MDIILTLSSCSAIYIFACIGFIAGIVLGYISCSSQIKSDPLVEQIDSMLPQNQCAQCGYPGCFPYAKAIVKGENINKCLPGGETLVLKIAAQLNISPPPMERDVINSCYEASIAWINEANCIGCTKCIQVCPVDAIIGAYHLLHTVIKDYCTGCNLCITPCPTNCIEIRPYQYYTHNSIMQSTSNILITDN